MPYVSWGRLIRLGAAFNAGFWDLPRPSLFKATSVGVLVMRTRTGDREALGIQTNPGID